MKGACCQEKGKEIPTCGCCPTKAGLCYQTYFPHMEIKLFCTCQMPETHDDMVECDTCGDWYHLKCVSLEQFPAEAEQWNCNKCFK